MAREAKEACWESAKGFQSSVVVEDVSLPGDHDNHGGNDPPSLAVDRENDASPAPEENNKKLGEYFRKYECSDDEGEDKDARLRRLYDYTAGKQSEKENGNGVTGFAEKKKKKKGEEEQGQAQEVADPGDEEEDEEEEDEEDTIDWEARTAEFLKRRADKVGALAR